MTKSLQAKLSIKGAIEVYADGTTVESGLSFEVERKDPAHLKSKYILIHHADLEAYVQERERKAFEAAREKTEQEEITKVHGSGFRTRRVSIVDKYKTFEDFKKENHE